MGDAARWHEYPGTAGEIYERFMVPAIFARWAPALLSRAELLPGERVLDAACGTGAVTRLAARAVRPGGSVVGLDLDPGMLAVARTNVPAEGESAPVAWREGTVLDLPFPNGTFDAALCQQGLQFFPDRVVALRELRRVLRPSGRLALAVWRSVEFAPGYLALSAALGRLLGPAATALPPFALGDGGQLRALVDEAGFGDVRVEAVEGDVLFPSSAEFVCQVAAGAPGMMGALARVGPGVREEVLRDVGAALRSYGGPDGLKLPIQSHLVSAHA